MKQGLVSIAILVLMVASLGSVVQAEFAPEPKVYNVKTFGAIGDGVIMDTKALQAAIDACNENHGGGDRLGSSRELPYRYDSPEEQYHAIARLRCEPVKKPEEFSKSLPEHRGAEL